MDRRKGWLGAGLGFVGAAEVGGVWSGVAASGWGVAVGSNR